MWRPFGITWKLFQVITWGAVAKGRGRTDRVQQSQCRTIKGQCSTEWLEQVTHTLWVSKCFTINNFIGPGFQKQKIHGTWFIWQNPIKKEPIRMLKFPSTIIGNMIFKYCDCITLLSLTLRVNSLIFGPFISLISHSGRPLTIFHWWRQPAKGTLSRKKNQSIELFLHFNSVMVLNSYITYVHEEIPEVFFSSFLQRSEFKALEIIAIS